VTSYLGLDDFIETAAELLGLPEETVVKMARLDLAESALHEPQGGLGRGRVLPGVRHEGGRADGEETFQRMRATAAAPAENLEVVEAEVAGWIAARLHPQPRTVD